MLEATVNFGIFMMFVVILAIISAIVRRSAILTVLFKAVGKLVLAIFSILFLLFFIFIESAMAGLVIFIHPFVLGDYHFFANGEPVGLLFEQDRAMMLFALTYGVLYVIIYLAGGRLLLKTPVGAFVKMISSKLMFIFRYRYWRRHHSYESEVNGIISHLTTMIAVFLLYPFAIASFFPDLKVTVTGNGALFICLFLFSMIPSEREQREFGR
ncbi:MAG TPA: hypothetical protein VK057_06610 [Bacillota bacterium]|nr:hypothetical protein [Bacillota bacterium]